MTWTVLHDACEHEDIETVIQRTKVNAEEANSLDDHGATPLHIACFNNPPKEMLEALIAAHPQALVTRDMHGDTPLHIALSNPATTINVIRTLAKACPKALMISNREGLKPLHEACRFGSMNDEIISLLVETCEAAAKVRIRVRSRVCVDFGSCFAIVNHRSALLRFIQMGDLVPSRGTHTPENQHLVVEGSPRRGAYGTTNIDLRFEAIEEQDRDGSYPLHMAVANRSSLHVLDMLINAAPEVVHCTNKYGETPLHVALHRTPLDDETVELLLQADEENQALKMAEDRGGNLPIHLALLNQASLSMVVQLLTRFPHAVRVANKDGLLPFDLAKGNEELMDILMVSDEVDDLDDVENISRVAEDDALSKITDDDVVEVASTVSADSF